jgi:hypothetical protein
LIHSGERTIIIIDDFDAVSEEHGMTSIFDSLFSHVERYIRVSFQHAQVTVVC